MKAPIGFPERVTVYLRVLEVVQGTHERSGGEVVRCFRFAGFDTILVVNGTERAAVFEVALIACRYDMDVEDLWSLLCRAGQVAK